jgi:hypothetical protein
MVEGDGRMADQTSGPVPVKFADLLHALELVSAGEALDYQGYIYLPAGTVHCTGDGINPEEAGLPEDYEDSDDYLAVPHKRDLDLGSRLVFAFAEEAMPDEYDRIRDIFRGRGAYGRLKDFLHAKGMLHQWYEFEEKATEDALRAWCRENGIVVEDD